MVRWGAKTQSDLALWAGDATRCPGAFQCSRPAPELQELAEWFDGSLEIRRLGKTLWEAYSYLGIFQPGSALLTQKRWPGIWAAQLHLL